MANGRPLRFLVAVAIGWVGLRTAVLWPSIDSAPAFARAMVPSARPFQTARDDEPATTSRLTIELPSPVARFAKRSDSRAIAETSYKTKIVVALASLPPVLPPSPSAIQTPALAAPAGLAPIAAPTASRWSISGWLLARGGRGASLDTPQLSGSQAGIRVAYLLDRRHRLAVAARVVTPLRGKGREAALGFDWQPTRLPIRLLVGQRFGLDGQRGGPAALLVGGFGPAPIGRGLTLEGYGEGGAVYRHRFDGFADGALRLAYPIATFDRVRLDLGAGLWGAAQRGVSRIDVGPSLGATIPIARKAIRLSVDWRQRIAGNARPGSGPAVTLGADF